MLFLAVLVMGHTLSNRVVRSESVLEKNADVSLVKPAPGHPKHRDVCMTKESRLVWSHGSARYDSCYLVEGGDVLGMKPTPRSDDCAGFYSGGRGWKGLETPWMKWIYERYETKYKKVLEVVDGVTEKKLARKNRVMKFLGHSSMQVLKLSELVGLVKAFQSCDSLASKVAKSPSAPILSEHETDGLRKVYPQVVKVNKWYWKKLKPLMSEGDVCCQEDCDAAGAKAGTCEPCRPVCADGECVSRKSGDWCFEKCCDSPGSDGQCDCSDGTCRVCKGRESLLRYAAKELKIALSFDLCPDGDLESDPAEDDSGRAAQHDTSDGASLIPKDLAARELKSRQYCGIFDPRKECSIRLETMVSLSPMDAQGYESFAKMFPGCSADLSNLPGPDLTGTQNSSWREHVADVVEWAGRISKIGKYKGRNTGRFGEELYEASRVRGKSDRDRKPPGYDAVHYDLSEDRYRADFGIYVAHSYRYGASGYYESSSHMHGRGVRQVLSWKRGNPQKISKLHGPWRDVPAEAFKDVIQKRQEAMNEIDKAAS